MFRDSWVRWGFGPALGERGQGDFTIDYSRATPHPSLKSPLLIAMEVCRDLYGQYGKPTVCLSGGVDSQAVAFAFKMSGVPARFVMARYNDGLNDDDIMSTQGFYALHGIEIEFIDVDILSFHENELAEWSLLYDCCSPHLLSHMKIASLFEGLVIFSGTVIAPDGSIGNLTWDTFGLERYARLSGRSLLGYFLTYDPHLHWAFGQTPSAISSSEPSYLRKCRIYQEAGFPVHPQERKMHGFEKVKEHYDSYPVPPHIRMKYKSAASRRPYDLMFRYPLEDKLPRENLLGARIRY